MGRMIYHIILLQFHIVTVTNIILFNITSLNTHDISYYQYIIASVGPSQLNAKPWRQSSIARGGSITRWVE